MKATNALFAALLCGHTLAAQVELKAVRVESPPGRLELSNNLTKFDIIEFDILRLNQICRTTKQDINFSIKGDVVNWTLTIDQNELRALNYQVIENGETLPNSTLSECITYKGFFGVGKHLPVRLTITADAMEGYVTTYDGLFFIMPVSKLVEGYQYNHSLIFRAEDIKVKMNQLPCGLAAVATVNKISKQKEEKYEMLATTTCRVLEIATEADYEFFQASGSNVTTANNSILTILNQVEGFTKVISAFGF